MVVQGVFCAQPPPMVNMLTTTEQDRCDELLSCQSWECNVGLSLGQSSRCVLVTAFGLPGL